MNNDNILKNQSELEWFKNTNCKIPSKYHGICGVDVLRNKCSMVSDLNLILKYIYVSVVASSGFYSKIFT